MTYLGNGARLPGAALDERSPTMTRTHRASIRLIRRLRPSPAGFAAAAAVQDPSLLLYLQAAQRDPAR